MKTETKKTTESGFISILKRDNKAIKGDRAVRIGRAAKNAFTTELNKKQGELDKIDDALETMIDVSASNSTTAINSVRDFDAETFVTKRAKLKLERALIVEKIRVLEEDSEFYGA